MPTSMLPFRMENFVAAIVDVAANLGIPSDAIHHEAFAL